MDWFQILMTVIGFVITTAIGFVITAVITFVGKYAVDLINNKIKDGKLKTLLGNVTTVIVNSVKTVTQTVVDDLKAAGKFDQAAQANAKADAIAYIKGQLTADMISAVASTYGSVDTYLDTAVEAAVADGK